MVKRFIIPMMILCCGAVTGQNLVPNPNFDQYVDCPESLDQLISTGNWKPLLGTPDFFHGCDNSTNVGTPLNLANGFQEPLSGEGYAGLIGIAYNNDREILGIELSQPLEVGTEYYVEFYWSRTFGGYAHSNCDCASSHLGALFTTVQYDNITDPIEYFNYAQVFDPTLHADSANWVKVSGWFMADSAYTHLALGDFFELNLNETAYYNGTSEELLLNTYYYIDNVCVSQDPDLCGLIVSDNILDKDKSDVSIYPNPVKDVLNIVADRRIDQVVLYDSRGREIRSIDWVGGPITLDLLPEGMYIVRVKMGSTHTIEKFIKMK